MPDLNSWEGELVYYYLIRGYRFRSAYNVGEERRARNILEDYLDTVVRVSEEHESHQDVLEGLIDRKRNEASFLEGILNEKRMEQSNEGPPK